MIRAILMTLVTMPMAFSQEPAPEATRELDSPKYGLKVTLPSDWEIPIQERDDLIFAAMIPQQDPTRPGAVACELALAPENLEEYRSRISANFERGRTAGTLTRNELVQDDLGERLVTVRELEPPFGGLWVERTVRCLANRQMYVFTLNMNTQDPAYPAALDAFEHLARTARFTPPNTGAEPMDETRNRWRQREFQFAIDLPEGWAPALAPSQLALFFANGPAHGIWSDNVLVIARPHEPTDLERLREDLPNELRAVEPGCEVLTCEVVPQGSGKALETVVRTQRGPFSMTVLERRFTDKRFDYEVKFTLESKRFDDLAPVLRKCLDSFEELPGNITAPGVGRAG